MSSDAAWVEPYYHFDFDDEVEHEWRIIESPSYDNLISDHTGKNCFSPLKVLRLVSHQYNAICTPLLYQELDLDILHRHTYEDLKTILQLIASTYGKYVRSVRIHIGKGHITSYTDYQWSSITGIMAAILSKCTNATTVAIYYRDGKEGDFGKLGNEIVRLVEANQVVAFGLFSMTIMRRPYSGNGEQKLQDTDAPMRMLEQLLGSETACQALQRLDLVMENISPPLFNLISSECTSLQSLTVRRSLRNRDRVIFISGQVWAPNDNLTSLKLMSCTPTYPPHILLLVQHFEGLKELVWANCGYQEKVALLPQFDWSKQPAFQPLIRERPLENLVLEHALEWDLVILGTIPAETVTVASLDELRLVRSMRRCAQMFPGVKVLRVLPKDLENQETPSTGEPLPTLDLLCAERKVILRRDAEVMHRCYCGNE
ncbi:hypothetical protein M408DRAFT_99847 [Serendipita vermifera MAFF 305830]|uniref:F-box domain-containing protein n=1 Tax=Serendipita vermifera MAFF 305830 TaxID=933852 RepID=A0A0C3BEW0_SERVB|nr:hypothetical protein M408DRAFT_99847 [Serendipita vermifera MAFF 305830]